MSQRVETGPGWEMERWLPIPGHDLYEASSLGRIRSWATRGFVGRRATTPKIVRPYSLASGHLRIMLGRGRRESVHVLIATTFIGPRGSAQVCRHMDGNPKNNRPDNLRWGTHRENVLDRDRHGTTPRGTKHHAAKLTDESVREIRASTESISALSRRFGVARKNVRLIRERRTWIHVAD